MATIKKLTAGQALYDVSPKRSPYGSVYAHPFWSVTVVEVDPAGMWVIARWNGNAPRKYSPREVKRWRLTVPPPRERVI